jgi:hypothetical protein
MFDILDGEGYILNTITVLCDMFGMLFRMG